MSIAEQLKEAGVEKGIIDAVIKQGEDLNAVNNEAKDRRKEIKSLTTQMDQFKGLDIEALKKAQTDLEKIGEENDLKAGEFGKVKDAMVKKHGEELDAANSVGEGWKNKYSDLAIDKALITAAAAGDAIKPEDIATLTRGRIKMSEEGEVTISDGKEGILMGEGGKSMDIPTFMKGFLNENLHYVKGKGGGAGSGGGQGGGAGDGTRTPVQKIADGLRKAGHK